SSGLFCNPTGRISVVAGRAMPDDPIAGWVQRSVTHQTGYHAGSFSFSITPPLLPIISEGAWLKQGRVFSIPAQTARYAVLRSASGIRPMPHRRFRPSGAFPAVAHIV